MVIVLDSGYGGIDSGVECGEWLEKQIILQFVCELWDILCRVGNFEIILMWCEDIFVFLECCVVIVYEVVVDIFIFFYVDIVFEGYVQGVMVYILLDEVSDVVFQYLVECYNWLDVFLGIDLMGIEDQVVEVFLDIVCCEMVFWLEWFVKVMVLGMQGVVGELNKYLYCQGGFLVLKVVDIFLVLIEIGFMFFE